MTHPVRHSFLFMLGLLVVLELAVRVFLARNMSARFEYGYHPTAGYVENSDGTVDLVRAGGRRFRPQSFSRRPEPGVFRVFVIGDSVPRGPSLEGAYAWQIGELLRARGVKAESYNLAVPGYGAHRDFLVLRKALDYEPGLVILHVNNSNEYEDEREWRRKEEFAGWHPKNWLMKSLLVRRLYEAKTEQLFWKWLPGAVRVRTAPNDADAEVLASMDAAKLRVWQERVKKFTAESVAAARQCDVPIILLTQARLERDDAGRAWLDDGGLDALATGLASGGVYHLSMKEVLSQLPFESLYADGAHLRAEGHKLLAAAVIEKLQAAGLVRP
jgi:hypothetical protein